MRLRASTIPLAFVAISAWAFGCQLLYDKNELTVETGGTGGTGTSTSTAGGTGGVTTTTSGGGTTGGGGTGGTTTSVGSGGTTSASGGTTSASGGTGGATTTTGSGGDMDGGLDGDAPDGPDCSGDRLLVLGTSPTGVLCATYSPGGGWSASTDGLASSNERPAAALLDAQTGVGVFFQGSAPGPLRSIEIVGGACGVAANVASVTTKAAPSVAVLGAKVHALFQGAVDQGTDHPFVTTWDAANKWSAAAQIDLNVFSQATAGLGASGAELLAVYGGGNDFLYGVRFAGGSWQLPVVSFVDAAMAPEQSNKAVTPAVVGLDGGGWLVVFQEKANPAQLRWLTTNGVIHAPSKVLTGALSSSPVSLAAIPNGAVLAFRGTDNGVYATVLDGGANGTWGPIERIGGAATTTLASPAVAAGVCAHRAELVYTDAADSSVRHASLESGAWSTVPAAVGGTATKGVAIARSP